MLAWLLSPLLLGHICGTQTARHPGCWAEHGSVCQQTPSIQSCAAAPHTCDARHTGSHALPQCHSGSSGTSVQAQCWSRLPPGRHLQRQSPFCKWSCRCPHMSKNPLSSSHISLESCTLPGNTKELYLPEGSQELVTCKVRSGAAPVSCASAAA